jgi:hypothetical protein
MDSGEGSGVARSSFSVIHEHSIASFVVFGSLKDEKAEIVYSRLVLGCVSVRMESELAKCDASSKNAVPTWCTSLSFHLPSSRSL